MAATEGGNLPRWHFHFNRIEAVQHTCSIAKFSMYSALPPRRCQVPEPSGLMVNKPWSSCRGGGAIFVNGDYGVAFAPCAAAVAIDVKSAFWSNMAAFVIVAAIDCETGLLV